MFRRLFRSRFKLLLNTTKRTRRQYADSAPSSSPSFFSKLFTFSFGVAAGGAFVFFNTGQWSLTTEPITIPVGHVGVVERSGKVEQTPLTSGRHWVPRGLIDSNKLHLFDTRTKMLHLTVEVPSKEGLSVSVEVAALYHLDPQKAPKMYETVGTDYEGLVVQPQFRAAIKQVCTGFDAKDFYHANTLQEISVQLTTLLATLTERRGISVEEIVVKRISLPAVVQAAIEQKLRMEQEMQQMQFVLEKEEAEAQRKAIEAKGVADFQRIVSEGISEELLLWKGIEATEKLSLSGNSKIVIIGSGDHGLPVIMHAENYKDKKDNKVKDKIKVKNNYNNAVDDTVKTEKPSVIVN